MKTALFCYLKYLFFMDCQGMNDCGFEVSQILFAQNFKCPLNKTSKFMCRNQKCKHPGLMCFDQQCVCHQGHSACDWRKLYTFLSLITMGTKKMPKEVKQSYDSIIDQITKFMNELQHIKQKYQNAKKYYGLLQTQISFLTLCKKGEYYKLNGETIAAVEEQQNTKRYIGCLQWNFRKQKIKFLCEKERKRLTQFFLNSLSLKANKKNFSVKQMEGDTFEGELNSQRQPHGFGIYTWKDGTYEVGRYENGLIQGNAICVKTDGTRYDHHYQNGLQNGMQFQYMNNGDCFEYGMKNGVRFGSYRKFMADGNFQGQLYQQCTQIAF